MRGKFLDHAIEIKKTVEHEHDWDTICRYCSWNGLQGLSKKEYRNWKSEEE